MDIYAIERPDRSLFRYYLLASFLAGPFFPIAMTVLWFRYRTLRYRFDDEGISMSWGALFRREIHLTFARIQDIHLASNVVERWLGLARIEIQTASGSAKAEMTLEGILEYEAVRDFLYSRMRGMRGVPLRPERQGEAAPAPAADGAAETPAGVPPNDGELTAVLREVAGELRALRRELGRPGVGEAGEAGEPPGGGAPVARP